MKKVAGVLLCAGLMLVFVVSVVWSAEKYASVDIIRIASEYNKAKDYNKGLETKAKNYETDVEKKINEIKQLQDKINLLNDKEKETKKAELENKIKLVQDFRRQKETDLRKEDFENSKVVVEDIKKAISQFADKEGFTVVFDDRILVYQSKGMDITDKVIDSLNKGYKK